jgi:hypothetical protein
MTRPADDDEDFAPNRTFPVHPGPPERAARFYLNELELIRTAPPPTPGRTAAPAPAPAPAPKLRKYRGVVALKNGLFRSRYSTNCGFKIVGDYPTAEEAARAHDAALVAKMRRVPWMKLTLNFPEEARAAGTPR